MNKELLQEANLIAQGLHSLNEAIKLHLKGEADKADQELKKSAEILDKLDENYGLCKK